DDAVVGNTRLFEALADDPDSRVFPGAASVTAGGPHTAIVGALRAHLRSDHEAHDECGPLRPHLAHLLPELWQQATTPDQETLLEAVRWALVTITAEAPAVMILDDLQWSDNATLYLIGALALSLADVPLVILAAYRSDEVPRGH